MIFLAETFSEITYHQLIEDLNQKTECFNHFFYKDVYSFYLNLLFAITQNQDLVLVDTDWSLEEISNYNISPDERKNKISRKTSKCNYKISIYTHAFHIRNN